MQDNHHNERRKVGRVSVAARISLRRITAAEFEEGLLARPVTMGSLASSPPALGLPPGMREKTVSLSAYGIGLAPGEAFAIGEKVQITLILPGIPPLPFALLGQVGRADLAAGEPWVGIAFAHRDDEERLFLGDYVSERLDS